jgi:putative hydrolase of the HAD superfamily
MAAHLPGIRAVLFDFAGTLFSDRALREVHLEQLRFVAACAGAPHDLDDVTLRGAYRRGMGVSGRALGGRSSYSHRDLFGGAFRAMAEELGRSIDDETVREAVDRQYRATIEHATLRGDAVVTLRGLRDRGLHTQIVSNIDDEQLQPMVRRMGLDEVLDAWTSSDEAGSCKPDPGIYRYALRKAGCDASAALFVGDSIGHDIVGPTKLGMRTAWLTADAKRGGDDHAPDHEIATLSEVLTIVDGANG